MQTAKGVPVTGGCTPSSTTSILAAIREELEAIGLELTDGFDPSSQWDEIDVDSVEVIELVAALEEQYGVDMTNEDYNELKTPETLARRVSQLVSGVAGASANA
jgi:acyl carrier protein